MPKDYAVEIKVRNNLLLRRMQAAGFNSALALAKASGVGQGVIGDFLNLRRAAVNKSSGRTEDANGERQFTDQVSKSLLRICETLRCLPEDVIPPQHWRGSMKRNTARLELDAQQAQALVASYSDGPHAQIEREQLVDVIGRSLQMLKPREERVLRMRWGLDGKEPMTLQEVADQFGLSMQSIRIIEARAMLRLKHHAPKELQAYATNPQWRLPKPTHYASAFDVHEPTPDELEREHAKHTDRWWNAESDAYREGERSYQQGLARSRNRFSERVHPKEHAAWLNGWHWQKHLDADREEAPAEPPPAVEPEASEPEPVDDAEPRVTEQSDGSFVIEWINHAL